MVCSAQAAIVVRFQAAIMPVVPLVINGENLQVALLQSGVAAQSKWPDRPWAWCSVPRHSSMEVPERKGQGVALRPERKTCASRKPSPLILRCIASSTRSRKLVQRHQRDRHTSAAWPAYGRGGVDKVGSREIRLMDSPILDDAADQKINRLRGASQWLRCGLNLAEINGAESCAS